MPRFSKRLHPITRTFFPYLFNQVQMNLIQVHLHFSEKSVHQVQDQVQIYVLNLIFVLTTKLQLQPVGLSTLGSCNFFQKRDTNFSKISKIFISPRSLHFCYQNRSQKGGSKKSRDRTLKPMFSSAPKVIKYAASIRALTSLFSYTYQDYFPRKRSGNQVFLKKLDRKN